jgi:hypothetical protein
MKTLTIGDLHGLADWKKVNPADFDFIIFLGDYIDSHVVDDIEMMNNLEEIISLKASYPEKVKLLLGNHEISYLFSQYRSTGFRYSIAEEVCIKLKNNINLFQVAWQFQNFLWTHAGINSDYYIRKIMPKIMKNDECLDVTLRRLFNEEYPPLFEVGPERGGWDKNSSGGPFWLDKSRLLENPLKGYHQIVGHTPVKTIEYHTPFKNDMDTSVTLCDCIERGDGSFYELEI